MNCSVRYFSQGNQTAEVTGFQTDFHVALFFACGGFYRRQYSVISCTIYPTVNQITAPKIDSTCQHQTHQHSQTGHKKLVLQPRSLTGRQNQQQCKFMQLLHATEWMRRLFLQSLATSAIWDWCIDLVQRVARTNEHCHLPCDLSFHPGGSTTRNKNSKSIQMNTDLKISSVSSLYPPITQSLWFCLTSHLYTQVFICGLYFL